MARYRVKTKSFINDTIVEEGTEVDYDGQPGDNLEPLDDAARTATAEVQTARDAKAAAIASGAGALLNEDMATQVAGFIDKYGEIVARMNALEQKYSGLTAPDLSTAAKASDVAELDAGMDILIGRLNDVEGALNALAAKAVPNEPPPIANPGAPVVAPGVTPDTTPPAVPDTANGPQPPTDNTAPAGDPLSTRPTP